MKILRESRIVKYALIHFSVLLSGFLQGADTKQIADSRMVASQNVKIFLSVDKNVSDKKRTMMLKEIVAVQSKNGVPLAEWLFAWNFDRIVEGRYLNSIPMGVIPEKWAYTPGINSIYFIDMPFLMDSGVSVGVIIGVIIKPPIQIDSLHSIVESRRTKVAEKYTVFMHIHEQ